MRAALVGVAILLVLLILASVRDSTALSALRERTELTWRQAEIIKTRDRVHACQDRLGFRRSPIAQRVIVGGTRYRAWVLFRWETRLSFCLDVERQLADPAVAIMAVFGPVEGPRAIRVFTCESHLRTSAVNGQYRGLAQMGDWARARFGHGSSVLRQVRAAHRLFVAVGRSWTTGQWPECGRLA